MLADYKLQYNNIHHQSDYNSTCSSLLLSTSNITSHELLSKRLAPKLLSEVLVLDTLSPFQQNSLPHHLQNSKVSANGDRNLPRFLYPPLVYTVYAWMNSDTFESILVPSIFHSSCEVTPPVYLLGDFVHRQLYCSSR